MEKTWPRRHKNGRILGAGNEMPHYRLKDEHEHGTGWAHGWTCEACWNPMNAPPADFNMETNKKLQTQNWFLLLGVVECWRWFKLRIRSTMVNLIHHHEFHHHFLESILVFSQHFKQIQVWSNHQWLQVPTSFGRWRCGKTPSGIFVAR